MPEKFPVFKAMRNAAATATARLEKNSEARAGTLDAYKIYNTEQELNNFSTIISPTVDKSSKTDMTKP